MLLSEHIKNLGWNDPTIDWDNMNMKEFWFLNISKRPEEKNCIEEAMWVEYEYDDGLFIKINPQLLDHYGFNGIFLMVEEFLSFAEKSPIFENMPTQCVEGYEMADSHYKCFFCRAVCESYSFILIDHERRMLYYGVTPLENLN